MVRRKTARYLAPIALVAAVVGTYLIVSKHVGSTPSTVTTSHVFNLRPRPRGRYKGASTYTVQQGDSLTSISHKTGVPIPTLEQLNQSLGNSPNTLQTGQKIRLRR